MVTWNDVKSCVESLRYVPPECAVRCNEENFDDNRDWCMQNCEARSDDVNKPAHCISLLYQYGKEQNLDPVILDKVAPYLEKLPSIKSGDILLPDHINSVVDALKNLAYAFEEALEKALKVVAPPPEVCFSTRPFLICVSELPGNTPVSPAEFLLVNLKERSGFYLEWLEILPSNVYKSISVKEL